MLSAFDASQLIITTGAANPAPSWLPWIFYRTHANAQGGKGPWIWIWAGEQHSGRKYHCGRRVEAFHDQTTLASTSLHTRRCSQFTHKLRDDWLFPMGPRQVGRMWRDHNGKRTGNPSLSSNTINILLNGSCIFGQSIYWVWKRPQTIISPNKAHSNIYSNYSVSYNCSGASANLE